MPASDFTLQKVSIQILWLYLYLGIHLARPDRSFVARALHCRKERTIRSNTNPTLKERLAVAAV